MNNRIRRGVARSLFLAAAVAGSAAAMAQQPGEEVWVKRPELEIRAGKGAAFDTVVTVKKGQKLQVIAREGTWLKVQIGDRQGYVSENSISAREIKGGGGLGAFAGGPESSGAGSAAAAKGLEDNAEKYASSKGLDPKILEQMIARTKAIGGEEWAAFAKEGQVGPDKPQGAAGQGS